MFTQHFVYLICELNKSMISGMSNCLLKAKLFVIKQIVFSQIEIQSVIHNFFQNFGKTRQNRYWPIICNIFFISAFVYGRYFFNFHFFRINSLDRKLLNIYLSCSTIKSKILLITLKDIYRNHHISFGHQGIKCVSYILIS